MEDICAQKTDDKKRLAISTLPRDLPEIFVRVLRRILADKNEGIASAMFLWAALAKRPLSIWEMREAIAVRVGQRELKESQLVTEIDQMVNWCNGLLVQDEEDHVVQFAHHSVKDFFLHQDSTLAGRKFNLKDQGDLAVFNISSESKIHVAGEVCCTYLAYNTFEDQVVLSSNASNPVSKTGGDLQPLSMAMSSLTTASKNELVVRSWKILESYLRKFHGIRASTESQAHDWQHNVQAKHAFLAYASQFWLNHTVTLSVKSPAWRKFTELIRLERIVVMKPWTSGEWADWENPNGKVLQFILEHEHHALLGMFLREHEYSTDNFATRISRVGRRIIEESTQLSKIFFANVSLSESQWTTYLETTVTSGQKDIVRHLLGPAIVYERGEKGIYIHIPTDDYYNRIKEETNIILTPWTNRLKKEVISCRWYEGEVHNLMERLEKKPSRYKIKLEEFRELVIQLERQSSHRNPFELFLL